MIKSFDKSGNRFTLIVELVFNMVNFFFTIIFFFNIFPDKVSQTFQSNQSQTFQYFLIIHSS